MRNACDLPVHFDLAQKPVGQVGHVGQPISMRVCASHGPKVGRGTGGTKLGFLHGCPTCPTSVPRRQNGANPRQCLLSHLSHMSHLIYSGDWRNSAKGATVRTFAPATERTRSGGAGHAD